MKPGVPKAAVTVVAVAALLVLLGAWFPSARANFVQWGHPGARILGRDEGRDRIYTPAEVLELVDTP